MANIKLPVALTGSRGQRRTSRPITAADVPTANLRADPGLRVPDLGDGGLEDVGAVVSELGGRMVAADKRIRTRQDSIEIADIETDTENKAADLLRDALTKGDLSKEADLVAFGASLSELKQTAIKNFKGTADGSLRLRAILERVEGTFIGEGAKQGNIIGRKKVETAIAGRLKIARSNVMFRPETFDKETESLLKRVRDDFPVFDPNEEGIFERVIPADLAEAAITSYMLRGQFENAENILARPSVAKSLGETKALQLFSKIKIAEVEERKAARDVRLRDVKGVPRDIFEAMSETDKRELLDLDDPTIKILSEKETADAGFEEGTVVGQKEGELPKVLQKPEDTDAEIERKARLTEQGKLTARRENIGLVLSMAGLPPLDPEPDAIFEGEEETETGEDRASDDVRSALRLVNASRLFLLAGDTARGNAFLSQAKFIIDNSPEIQRRRELDKPVSSKVASDLGVPLGTTLGEVSSVIPRSPEVLARDVAEGAAFGRGRVKAREQIAFVDQAVESIRDLLERIADDPDRVGIMGSLRATGQTAVGVLSDLGLKGIVDQARTLALGVDISADDFEDMFNDPTLSTLKIFENSVGLILARLRTPEGRVPVEVIKRSINDVKISGLTSTVQVENRLNFVLNVLSNRAGRLRETFNIEPEIKDIPQYRVKDGKLEKIE